jgi:hypothetical protein
MTTEPAPPKAPSDDDDDDRDHDYDPEETPQEAAVRLLTRWTRSRLETERRYRKRVAARARHLSSTDRAALRRTVIRNHEILLEAIDQHDDQGGGEFSFPSEDEW